MLTRSSAYLLGLLLLGISLISCGDRSRVPERVVQELTREYLRNSWEGSLSDTLIINDVRVIQRGEYDTQLRNYPVKVKVRYIRIASALWSGDSEVKPIEKELDLRFTKDRYGKWEAGTKGIKEWWKYDVR